MSRGRVFYLDAACNFSPAPGSGAYGHWRCQRRRWHLGPHRFLNYVIPRTSPRGQYRSERFPDHVVNTLPRRTRYKPEGSWWTGRSENVAIGWEDARFAFKVQGGA